jgi:cobalt/nickel transport system ATP-binding protein
MTSILALCDVHYRYPGATAAALDGVSVAFPPGQRIALVGRNGSGKSTLMLHCNGILRPQQGCVQLDGQAVRYDRRGLLMLRRYVGLVLQNPDDQLFSASVRQDISFGPLNLGLDQATARERVDQAAALCQVTDLLDRPTHALSGGEKTRVALAGVLAMDPQLLVADEVAGGLDPWMRQVLFSILDRLVEQGKTVVLSTHDLSVARTWADTVIFMQAGRILIVAPPAQIFSEPDVLAATELDRVMLG